MSLFKFRTRASSDTLPAPAPISRRWAERANSRSGLTHVASTPSLRDMPNSILLKYTDKDLVTENNSLSAEHHGSSFEENETNLRKQYAEQLKWVKENGQDFVALESMKTAREVSALLFALAENKAPTLVQLKINCNEKITVSYQFLDKFKQEFMMLKVSKDYFMFMVPF